MTLSFIITSSKGTDKNLTVTLESILKQTNKKYEIIIIDDGTDSSNLEIANNYFQNNSDVIKVITTWKEISTATCWNLGLQHAKGQYVQFLQPGCKLFDNFVDVIIQEINDYDEPDIIEFMVQYSNAYDHISSRRLQNNHTYHPLLNREVFALIHHSLFNKIFKRKIIIRHHINFRDSNRFDLLFIYKLLPWIEKLYTSEKVLIDIEIKPTINFNSFDFLKQWVHIYNYYRQINLAKELNEELEYAFVRFHYYTFLKVIAPTNNQILMRKAIKEITSKVNKRFPKWQENSYFNVVPQDMFHNVLTLNWKKYLQQFN